MAIRITKDDLLISGPSWAPLLLQYPRKVVLDGEEWPSCAHFVLSKRFPALKEQILAESNYDQAEILTKNADEAEDWDEQAMNHLKRAIKSKFGQHADLKDILVSSQQYDIVYHDADEFLGDGGDGDGKNMVGEMLAIVREEIRLESLRSAMSGSGISFSVPGL